jgi:hypothetical protein
MRAKWSNLSNAHNDFVRAACGLATNNMRTILGFLVAFWLSTPVSAAGAFDGVYLYGPGGAFYSVHQNGPTLLTISLGSIPANGIGVTSGPYVIKPPTLEFWAYSIGAVNGNTARVVGVGFFGACQVTTDLTFVGDEAHATFVSAANTLLGNQQGVSCQSLMQITVATVGPTITLRRIF